MKKVCSILFPALLLAAALPAYAADAQADKPDGGKSDEAAPSPVGLWQTVDDDSGAVKSVVKIWEDNGKFSGKITKLIVQAGEDPDPKCDKCEGDRKDKPVTGMTILWDLKKDKDEWSGGTILDPDNGKTYRCYIKVLDGGKRLKVRGYLGISLFGRTQYWLKAE